MSNASSLGLPIADYQLATTNQAQLLAQFQKSSTANADIAAYQAGVSKITTVDQFLNNHKVLNVALTAYGMQDAINQKGLLKQLLTQDPTATTALAQKLGKTNYVAFARAFWSLSTDGGAGISSAASIDTTAARYNAAQFRQWQANRSNDPQLATALAARQTLQDAVDISNVGALFAKYQQTTAVQSASTYYQRNIGDVKTPADLIADPKLLNFALTAFGIDPASVSTDTVTKLLSQSPATPTSVAANNPVYQPFANAFNSLFYDKGANIHATTAITDVVNRYQQQTFSAALANHTDDQNKQMFGAAGAVQVKQIKADVLAANGASIASTYYGAHIGAATTASQFLADKQLSSVALAAFGLGNVSVDTLQKLLTENPTDAASVAQKDPQFSAFAKAFSYYPTVAGRTSDDSDKVASVQSAYQANTLKTILTNDVSLAAAQKTRNTNVHENANAALNLYQMLGDSKVSTVILGALGQPAVVGGYDPDQQVEIVTHAGFAPESLNSTAAIDSLVKRYMANVGAQNAPTSPLLTLFNSSSSGQIVSLDLSSILGSSSSSTALSSSPTGYLLNLI
jgi:predicted Fe-Mo cluster-binding NifX family protein